MSPIDRKSSIRKAPAADVVESITRAPTAPASAGAGAGTVNGGGESVPADRSVPEPRRVGAGRPRSKRRMEPFSSKIEIALRDRLDEYLQANEMTVVDFLDAAIRDRLQK
ncbi:hypothetical protein B7R25_02070 [Subtercola boreus]|uniref:Uncharacterized protein n=1 Tax=Subtercola boreus TaxID=120213 RepID=A0A3E0WFW6_9MICO|nr:hypothetical protein B7R24_02070 [Subtercola boreus]RFA23334.1 hypothetical protein B7R23_02060 [Subtercola boreus]RFA29138.1 hypothetical protein B7R25_02070 [Subtercola boreus]